MVPTPSREKRVESELRASEWNLRTVFIFVIIVFALVVPGKHFTLLDAIITQHEPFRSDFNGPLSQPGLVHISDNVTQIIPGKVFTQEQLRAGRLPLWNPRIFCGQPHVADLHSQVFSITDTPFLFFTSVDDALGAAALLKLLLAGYFMYLFCRHLWIDRRLALAAGTLYALSSFTLAWIHFPSFLSTALYYPLGLMFLDRYLTQVDRRVRMRSQLWLGVLCGLMILGGQLQLFANFIILAVIYALFSGRGTYVGSRLRRLKGLIWPLVIGLLVGMVQLLPTIELMLNSTRAPIGDFNLVTDLKAIASEPGLRLSVLGNFLEKILTLAFPFGWGRLFPTNAQPFPEAVIYVGVTALLCFLAPGRHHRGPFDRFLRKLCVAAILVNIFSLVLNSVFSFIGALEFLNPGRCAMSMAVLALPLLAAWRLDAFRKGDVRLDEAISRRGARAVLSLLLLVTIGATAVMIIITLQLGRALLNPVTAVLFYSGELVVVALLLRHLARAGTITGRDATIEVASAAMIAEGLLLAAVLIFPGARLTTDAVKDNSLTMLFSHEGRPFRVARYVPREEDDFRNLNRLVKQRSPILKPNEAMIIGVDDFQGYNSLNPRVAGEYIKGIDERLFLNLRGSIDLYSPEQLGAPQLDDANVVFILSEVEIDYPNLVKELDQPVKVYRRITARPRVFRRTDDGGTVPADVIEYRPGYLRVECSTTERSDLILSENFLPGWKAFMDGERAEISTYKSSPFMSVAVPPGEHEVVLAYQPASFVIGFILSLLGLAVVLLLWLLFSRRASSSRRTVSSPSVDTS